MPSPPYIWQYQREMDIRKEVDSIIDALVRNYEQTDPAKGSESESRKYEIAEQSIDLWWMLYDELLFWAQSHIAGKIWAGQNKALASKLAKVWGIEELTVDSHFLERLGHDYGICGGIGGDPLLEFEAQIENIDEQLDLSQSSLRSLIRELLMSHARKSSFWRHELQDGLRALNLGQAVEPLVPTTSRRRADFIETLELKSTALCRVNFLVGQGIKKHVARERVAHALGQSSETLRSWEKLLADGGEEFQAEFYAARLAGRFEDELEKGRIDKLEEEYGDDSFRNRSYWQMAQVQLARAKNIPLERIRDELNSVRRSKKMASKVPPKIPKKR